MERLSVQNTALCAGLLDFVKQHDAIQESKEGFYKCIHIQDSAGAIYTLTAQRDAGDDGLTSIKVISKWHTRIQLDNVVVARHLERNSPRSIRVVGSEDSISVLWFLQSGLYLVEPFAQRATDVITWISKLRCVWWAAWCIGRIRSRCIRNSVLLGRRQSLRCAAMAAYTKTYLLVSVSLSACCCSCDYCLGCRFWVLSARLQQSLSVWTHTPSSSRTSMHCITPKLQIATEPRSDAFEAFVPVPTSPQHLPVQNHMMSVLTACIKKPLSCSIIIHSVRFPLSILMTLLTSYLTLHAQYVWHTVH